MKCPGLQGIDISWLTKYILTSLQLGVALCKVITE